jgi:hypothetical protein
MESTLTPEPLMVNQILISQISIKENYEAEFNNDLANLSAWAILAW